jgi:branched-chain amino acid transport system substrate-binding protein
MRIWIRFVAVLIISVGISGCKDSDVRQFETNLANTNSEPIVIGILASALHNDSLLRGVKLAVKEINAKTAFQNHPLQIEGYMLPESESNEMDIVRKMIGNDRLLAVINGLNTKHTALADRILLIHKKIHIVIANSSMSISQDSPLSFRIIPNDRIVSRQIVDRMEWNWHNVAVIQERDDKRVLQVKTFLEAAAESGINISQTISFFPWENDIRQLLWNLREKINKNQEYLDAIYIACDPINLTRIIKQVRAMNLNSPIITPNDLQNIIRLQAAGSAANGLLMASYFNPDAPEPHVQEFVKRFRSEYPNNHPDLWAARGFDAIWMLAKSIELAKTDNAWEVASEMLLVEKWHGVTGRIVFNIAGDVSEYVPYYLKQYCNGNFIFLTEDQPIPLCPPYL